MELSFSLDEEEIDKNGNHRRKTGRDARATLCKGVEANWGSDFDL